MKNKILILNIIISFLIAVYIFLQIPVVKYSTEKAIDKIENKYLSKNLKEEELKKYNSLKKLIIWNQDIAVRTNINARIAGIIICILFIANNLYILIKDKKSKV